jgi:thymidylate synthase
MNQYLDTLAHIVVHGDVQTNRTGIKTISVPGVSMRFDLQEGFPAITTKKLAFKTCVGELVGFLRSHSNAQDFRALGCKVWDQNANENHQWLANPYRLGEDDLGKIYGVQWRQWPGYKFIQIDDHAKIKAAEDAGYVPIGQIPSVIATIPDEVIFYKAIDQLGDCLEMIQKDPGSRRILFHGWNPAQLDEMALPPCHLLYQFLVNQAKGELSLCLYIRSNDMFLGAPFNIAEAAVLLSLMAHLTGYKPRWLSYFVGDAHIYENHFDAVMDQLSREPYPLPKLVISSDIPKGVIGQKISRGWLDMVKPSDFTLEDYQSHPTISAPMAV